MSNLRKFNLLSLCLIICMITGTILVPVKAAGYDIYTKAGFDDFTLSTSGTTEGGNSAYSAEYNTITSYWAAGREISCVDAPSPEDKMEGSSFTKGSETDKALKYTMVSGTASGSNYIRFPIDTQTDMYSKDKIILSMNVYIVSSAGTGYLTGLVRDSAANSTSLFRLKSDRNLNHYPNNTATGVMSFSDNKWYNIKFEIDPKTNQYDLYVNDIYKVSDTIYSTVSLFPGHPSLTADSTKKVINEFRFWYNNGSTAAGCSGVTYVDDLYFGEPPSEEIEEPEEPADPTEPTDPRIPAADTATTYHQVNFDNLTLDNQDTQTAGTAQCSGDAGGVYLSWKKGRELNSVTAPSGTKYTDTSLSAGAADKALQFKLNSIETKESHPYINLSFDPNTINMYEKDKIVFSINTYLDDYVSSGSNGYLNVDLRYGTSSSQISNLFRLANNKLITFARGGESKASVSPYYERPVKQWVNIRIEFNPKDRTYSLFLNGVEVDKNAGLSDENICFPGDTDTTKTPFKEMRFQIINDNNTNKGSFYVDDIFFGEQATEKLKINKLYFSNGISDVIKVAKSGQIVYARADVTYSKLTADKDFTLISALYNGDGKLVKIWSALSNLPAAQGIANVGHTVNLPIPLSDVALEEDSHFKVFVLRSADELTPLAEAKAAGVFTANEVPGENPTIHLVGDSICMSYTDPKVYPQQGWGYYIGDYFKSNVKIINWAMGSRSTKSFIDEGRWDGKPLADYPTPKDTVNTGVLNVIQPGDYVFVWMGHNDTASTSGDGYTKGTTVSEYKDYLRRYADDTRGAGANVIFITSVTMAGQDNLSAKAFVKNYLLERANAMKEVAEEKNIVLLDINQVTWDSFNALGYQNTIDKYFMSKDTVRALFLDTIVTTDMTYEEIEGAIDAKIKAHPYDPIKNNGMDLTHVTDNGADYLAQTIIDLLKVSASPLKDYTNDSPDRSAGSKIKYNLYPNQTNKAVTFSFDDGKITDRDVVSVLNSKNLKGTFHLVPSRLNTNGFLASSEVSTLFNGHEMSNHGNTHSKIDNQTPEQYAADILNCKTTLSGFTDYKVNGYAYPFGGIENTSTTKTTLSQVYDVLKNHNIIYARAAGNAVNYYTLPSDFYQWKYQVRIGPDSTSATTADAFDRVQSFVNLPEKDTMQIFMTFAHGHEISDYALAGKENTGWDLFNEYCQAISGKADIWYATMAEIAEYAQASNSLKAGLVSGKIKNPTDKSVWITLNGVKTEIKPGRAVNIQ